MQAGHTALDVAEGAGLGFVFQVKPEVAEILREELVAQGLPVPAPKDRVANGR